MRTSLVVIFTGADRPGIVDLLAGVVAEQEGNWAASRLACLAGRFAGIIEATVDPGRADALVGALLALEAQGLKISVERGQPPPPSPPSGTLLWLELIGTDHPGIVHDVSHVLAERGLNIEELSTDLDSAPMSGQPMFRASVQLTVPRGAALDELQQALERLADDLMVDITLDDNA